MTLVEKITSLHAELAAAQVPHAFGGALALAWCTQRARGTIDIDINVFVPAEEARPIFERFPPGIVWSDDDVAVTETEGQVRLWWDDTPVDVFLNTTAFHSRCLGLQANQLFDRFTRAPFSPYFQQFAQNNERDDHSRCLKIDMLTNRIASQCFGN